jgi:hypothetical protein
MVVSPRSQYPYSLNISKYIWIDNWGLRIVAEERLIGYEGSTAEDVQAIEEYETAKKNKKLFLEPLNKLTKGHRFFGSGSRAQIAP